MPTIKDKQNREHKMLCPMCDTELGWHPVPEIYKEDEHVTHIYTCPECPFIGIEYLNNKNIDDLRDYLNK